MNRTPEAVEDGFEQPEGDGMLDDPAHSRQWVARRLQRALSVERWGAPLRAGLAGGKDGPHRILAEHAATAEIRAARLVELIRMVGSEPYGAIGAAERLTRHAGSALAIISRTLADQAATWLATHALSEYEALEAFVEDAPGVPGDLSAAVVPLHGEVRAEAMALSVIASSNS